MINFCIDNLEEIKSLLIKLNSETYNYRSGMLDHGTIGQHCRHVIECYECLIDGNKGQIVDYDLRKRCKMTETDQFVAINKIDSIITELLLMLEDKDLSVKVNFSSIDFNSSHTKSTLHRELMHNLDHAIHHQALMKVVLNELGQQNLLSEQFGYAPSTLRFRKECAQ